MDKLFFVFLCSALGSPRQPLGDQPPDDNKQGTTTIHHHVPRSANNHHCHLRATAGNMRLFTTLILSLFVFVAACCADAYAERHTDLLKRLAPPPPLSLSKRAPAFKTGAAGYGCDK